MGRRCTDTPIYFRLHVLKVVVAFRPLSRHFAPISNSATQYLSVPNNLRVALPGAGYLTITPEPFTRATDSE